jgi:hypothetical protein
MLQNLDMLLEMEVLEEEDSWDVIEELDQATQADEITKSGVENSEETP